MPLGTGAAGVTAVEAETAPDNAASIRVLAKLGFQPTGTLGEEGPRFLLKKISGYPLTLTSCQAVCCF